MSLGLRCVQLDYTSAEAAPERAARHGQVSERLERLAEVREARLAPQVAFRVAEGRACLFQHLEGRSARAALLADGPFGETRLRRVARGMLEGVAAVGASLGMTHRFLSLDAVFLGPQPDEFVRLADWGVGYAIDCGRCIEPPLFLGVLQYAAPEVFENSFDVAWTSDVWSTGVCLLELLTGRNPFAEASRIAAVCDPATGPDLLKELMEGPEMDRCSNDFKVLLEHCLRVNPCDRWDAHTALQSAFFTNAPVDAESASYKWMPSPFLDSSRLQLPTVEELYPHVTLTKMHMRERSLDVEPEPNMGSVIEEEEEEEDEPARNNGQQRGSSSLDGATASVAPGAGSVATEPRSIQSIAIDLVARIDTFEDGLSGLFPELQLPPLEDGIGNLLSDVLNHYVPSKLIVLDVDEARARAELTVGMRAPPYYELWDPSEALPESLEEREQDVGYQQHRVNVFLPLLQAGDGVALAREAAIDVPPVLRMEIWAKLLDLASWEECDRAWEEIEAELAKPHPSDHQIEVDVPRCNARHELIGTHEGRQRLTRVLKAWCALHPELEYWQGLDSLAAPFVALTFDYGEGRAFAMLSRLVTRFLAGMFLQKNTSQLQTQLIVFNQLLAYHDPQLFLHLQEQQFNPELYAIPWFLTLFTHILSIESTMRLWDFLFLHDATMIHFSSIAVMRQLRTRLLGIDFNDLVLFFSELHSKSQIDMSQVLSDAVRIARVTPPSLCSDHSQENSSLWWEQKASLEALQEHVSPKLSAEDLVTLLKQNRVALLVFDVRSAEDFKECHLDGAINIAAQDVDLKAIEQVKTRKPIIVAIADRGKENDLPNVLVQAGVPRVCYLSGGMDALRKNGSVKLVSG